jgi:hypothetical protein
MRYAFGTTPKSHFFAQVVAASSANAALSARDADLECDSITNSEIGNLGADGSNDAGWFMTKWKRGTSAKVAIGEFLVVAYVWATDSGRLENDLKLTLKGLFYNSGLLVRTVRIALFYE